MPILVLIISLLLSAPALAKLYRWVDEDGRVHYGDRVPPKYAQQERQTLNERGMVVEERNKPPTPEEEAERRAAEEEEKAARRQEDEQKRYDRFLLGTYSTQDQILLRRDEQLGILDGRIASAEKSVKQSGETLAELKQRAEGRDKVPDKLARQIKDFQRAVDSGTKALNKMKAERERVSAEFERDLARFLELTGES